LKEKLVVPFGRTAVHAVVSRDVNAVIPFAGIVDALSAEDMVAWKSKVTTRPAIVLVVVVGGSVVVVSGAAVVVGATVVDVVGATVVLGVVFRVGSFTVVVVAFAAWPPCETGLRMGTDVVVVGSGRVVVVVVVVGGGSVVVASCAVVEVAATSSVSPVQDRKVRIPARSMAMSTAYMATKTVLTDSLRPTADAMLSLNFLKEATRPFMRLIVTLAISLMISETGFPPSLIAMRLTPPPLWQQHHSSDGSSRLNFFQITEFNPVFRRGVTHTKGNFNFG
jgi:hypothetical protein